MTLGARFRRSASALQNCRETLQELLGQITDRAFRKLLIEAQVMLKETVAALTEVGLSRRMEREQQLHLISIAAKFQGLVPDALAANHGGPQSHHSLDNVLIVRRIATGFARVDTPNHAVLVAPAHNAVVDAEDIETWEDWRIAFSVLDRVAEVAALNSVSTTAPAPGLRSYPRLHLQITRIAGAGLTGYAVMAPHHKSHLWNAKGNPSM